MPFHQCTLKNGVRVVIEEMPERDVVVFNARIKAGWAYQQSGEEGAAHLLEHVLFHGTEKFPSYKKLTGEIESLGGSLYGATAAEYISLWASGPAHLAPALLTALIDMIAAPLLDADVVAQERAVIAAELASLEDDELSWMLHHLNGLLWPGHVMDENIEAMVRCLPTLSRQTLKGFHERLFKPQNVILAAGGKIEASWLIGRVESHFAAISSSSTETIVRPAASSGPRFLLREQDSNMLYCLLGFPAPGYRDADRPAMELVHSILGGGMTSRLYHELRVENDWLYHVEAFYDKYGVCGVYGVYLELPVENLEVVLRTTLSQMHALSQQGVNGQELLQAKALFASEKLFESDAVMGRVRHLAMSEVLAGEAVCYKDDVEKVQATEPEPIQQAAQNYFTAENAAVCMVGPIEQMDEIENQLRLWIHQELPPQ